VRLEVNAHALAAAVKAVTPAASTDDARQILTGVWLHSHEGHLRLVTCDSYRMHAVTLDNVEVTGLSSVVPAGWLARWAAARKRALYDRDGVEHKVRLAVTKRRVWIDEGDETTAVAPIPYNYPNADTLLDEQPVDEGFAAVNPTFLSAAWKAAEGWSKASGDHAAAVQLLALHPLKPCRFKMVTTLGTLQLIVMPVRVVP